MFSGRDQLVTHEKRKCPFISINPLVYPHLSGIFPSCLPSVIPPTLSVYVHVCVPVWQGGAAQNRDIGFIRLETLVAQHPTLLLKQPERDGQEGNGNVP